MSLRKPYVKPERKYPQPIPEDKRVRSIYAGSIHLHRVCAVPKDEVTAKPGKRTPTKLEAEWMTRIVEYGCIACKLEWFPQRTPVAVHHILRGGRRMGHLFTLPLCDPGHHQNGAQFGITSRHPYKARFEALYGTELELLAKLKVELGVFDKAEYR